MYFYQLNLNNYQCAILSPNKPRTFTLNQTPCLQHINRCIEENFYKKNSSCPIEDYDNLYNGIDKNSSLRRLVEKKIKVLRKFSKKTQK